MLLKYNSHPFSAYACEDGIKHLIGNSKSVIFNKDKFKDVADEVKCESIASFPTLDEAREFAQKLNLEVVENDNIYYLTDLREKYNKDFINIKGNFNIYSGETYEYEVFLFKKVVGRIRNSNYDEKSLLVENCVSSKCVLCDNDEDNLIVVFETSNGFRSEAICRECYNKRYPSHNVSSYIDKDKLLIDILKEITE